MTEWKTYRLGDICKRVCSGGTPKSTESTYYDGNIPWLNTKEINFNRIYSTERCITQKGLDNSSAKWIDANCVIVAMYGATAAKVAINKIPLTTNQACCNLSIDKKNADYHYVYYWLCANYTELASLANGGAQQNLNAQQIKDFEISLPSLEEQRRIAGILSAIDDKIENNRRINTNLELQAKALYKQWFVDFEFPNEEGKPYKSSGGKMLDSELGPIPEEWSVGKLEDIGDIIGGGTPSKAVAEYYTKNGIAWITPKDLSVSHSKFTAKGETDITELGYKNSSAKIMPRGSVLFSSRAPIGYISIAKNDICTNQGFKSVVPNNGCTAFVYYFLLSNTENIESKATGSTFKEASGALMKSLDLVIPSEDILEKFENIMSPIFESQENFEAENETLATLRDTLLPKLMSGELKISEYEIHISR